MFLNVKRKKNLPITMGRQTVVDQINDKRNSIFEQPMSIKEFVITPPTKMIRFRLEYLSLSGKSSY